MVVVWWWWCGVFLPIIIQPQQKLFEVVLGCWLSCGNRKIEKKVPHIKGADKYAGSITDISSFSSMLTSLSSSSSRRPDRSLGDLHYSFGRVLVRLISMAKFFFLIIF